MIEMPTATFLDRHSLSLSLGCSALGLLQVLIDDYEPPLREHHHYPFLMLYTFTLEESAYQNTGSGELPVFIFGLKTQWGYEDPSS